MQTTTNYGLKIYEGTDLFNPLTVENVNTSDLDTIVKGVSNAAVGTATELLTGTVHALTRADTSRNVFHFTATANFEAGETFEVDGVQVTAKTPDGQNLSTGAYVINSSVLCILDGTLLTVIVNPAKALDADKLDGHDSTYFATAGDLTVLDNQVGAISTKVGTGVLDVGNDCVDGINTLNTHLTPQAISISSGSASWTFDYCNAYKIGNIVILKGSFHATTITSMIKLKDFITKVGRPYQDIVVLEDTTNNIDRVCNIGINGNNVELTISSNVPTNSNVVIDTTMILLPS